MKLLISELREENKFSAVFTIRQLKLHLSNSMKSVEASGNNNATVAHRLIVWLQFTVAQHSPSEAQYNFKNSINSATLHSEERRL